MLKILQFKVGGKYDYNVVFETTFEKRKNETNDEPTNDLLLAVSKIVIATDDYLKTFLQVVVRFLSAILEEGYDDDGLFSGDTEAREQ
jgi:hypothetical protein